MKTRKGGGGPGGDEDRGWECGPGGVAEDWEGVGVGGVGAGRCEGVGDG